MASYIISKEINITRQEGDTADVVFNVPSILDMSPFTEVKFQVKSGSATIISKSLSGSSISVSGQVITIALAASDTKGKASGRWELEVSADSDIKTIGRGDFNIIPELIK